MPFGHKAGLPPSKKYLLVRQPPLFSLLFELEFNYVNSAKLLAVLRILLCVESNLLALFKSLEAVAYDCGKVYEYVVAAVIVGDESVAFLRIEPLNCTVVHFGTSIKN